MDDLPYVLPQTMYLRDKNGLYLQAFDPNTMSGGITLSDMSEDGPDSSCIWKAELDGTGYWISSVSTGKYWGPVQGDPYMIASYNTKIKQFNMFHTSGDNVYLSVDGHYMFNSTTPGTGGLTLSTDITARSCFQVTEAVLKTTISDIQYDIANATADFDTPPIIALVTTVVNDSDDTIAQTLTYSYTRSKTGTWNNTVGATIGASVTFSTELPFVDASAEVSLSASYSHEFGGSVGTSEEVTSSTVITVPGNMTGHFVATVKNAKLEVDFTYTETKWYYDGTTESISKSGVYRNLESYSVVVAASNSEQVTSQSSKLRAPRKPRKF